MMIKASKERLLVIPTEEGSGFDANRLFMQSLRSLLRRDDKQHSLGFSTSLTKQSWI